MSNESNSQTRKMTKRGLQKHILTAMGEKTPAQVALDFQRTYLVNWMSKQGKRVPRPPQCDTTDEG